MSSARGTLAPSTVTNSGFTIAPRRLSSDARTYLHLADPITHDATLLQTALKQGLNNLANFAGPGPREALERRLAHELTNEVHGVTSGRWPSASDPELIRLRQADLKLKQQVNALGPRVSGASARSVERANFAQVSADVQARTAVGVPDGIVSLS